MGQIEISFRPHWVNAGWYRLFTRPFADVDGETTPCSWTAPTTVVVSTGDHLVRTFIRYRRLLPGDLGAGELRVDVPHVGGVRIEVTNGPTNQSPFTPRVAPGNSLIIGNR